MEITVTNSNRLENLAKFHAWEGSFFYLEKLAFALIDNSYLFRCYINSTDNDPIVVRLVLDVNQDEEGLFELNKLQLFGMPNVMIAALGVELSAAINTVGLELMSSGYQLEVHWPPLDNGVVLFGQQE